MFFKCFLNSPPGQLAVERGFSVNNQIIGENLKTNPSPANIYCSSSTIEAKEKGVK